MKKKDTKAPPKRKKERNVMVCPAVPSEKKKRETVQIGYSSYKRKKELRERRNVCWPHGRVENPVDRNIIEIREKKKKLRYTMQVLHSIPLGGAVRQVGAL
jgi:hypothetical protein